MSATNQQMTREQLDELMVVAVSMQRDAEKLGERPVAVFAYAVQLALAELQKTRQQLAAVVAENDRAVKAVTVFSNVTDDITEIICDELGQERVAEIVAAYNDLGNMPATDAYLAEVRAQGVELLLTSLPPHYTARADIEAFAAQLRQGAKS